MNSAEADSPPKKVTICHVTQHGRVIPLKILKRAAKRHLRHGDFHRIEFFADADSDGLGDPANAEKRCQALGGFVNNADDCDDNNAEIGGPMVLFTDADGDGFGDPSSGQMMCPANGQVDDHTDCDDTNASINPRATEIEGNGIDDDCKPDTPDETQVQCPCAGMTHGGATWGDAFSTTNCVQFPNSLFLQGNPITAALESSPGAGFCNIFPPPPSNVVFQRTVTAAEGAACIASLSQIALNDGIPCP